MKQSVRHEQHPVFTLELEKDESRFDSVDKLVDYFKKCIDEHPIARFIDIYDHYSHTCELDVGTVDSGILAAKNIIFCFGLTLPDPEVLAVRPRSIGVAETFDRFIITFMEAPMPVANITLENWALNVKKQG